MISTDRWEQVRWARATHIETLQQPKIYTLHHPLFFWAALKREVGPILVFFATLTYLLTAKTIAYFSAEDIALRVGFVLVYNWLRNPDRGPRHGWCWIVPGLLFYNVPLPAIQMWSLFTLWDGGWGTSMRASGEISKRERLGKRVFEIGFFVLWMGVVGGAAGRLLSQFASLGPAGTACAVGVGFFGLCGYFAHCMIFQD